MRKPARRGPAFSLALYIVFLATRDDLLELDTRRRLFEVVQEYPGLHLRELARRVEMNPNHAKYHLQYLEKHGLISSKKQGGYWTFFPLEEGSLGLREQVDAREKHVLALLRRPIPLHVTIVLLDRDEASLSELGEAVDASPSTLHYHMGKMEKAGLVESRREGRERRFRLPDHDEVLALLMRFRPPDELVQGFLEAWEELEFP